MSNSALHAPLLLPVCTACKRAHWYPRPFCPFCFDERIERMEASGRGTVYSYSVALPSHPVLAYVELEEGPRILTRLVDTPHDVLCIGMAVRLVWREQTTDVQQPFFTAAGSC